MPVAVLDEEKDLPPLRTKSTLELFEEATGMILPNQTLAAIREIGIPLNALASGEIQAINEATNTSNQVADPNGVNLLDRLTLTADEAAKQQAARDDDDDDDDTPDDDVTKAEKPNKKNKSFVQMLKDKRAEQIAKAAAGEDCGCEHPHS